MNKLPLLSPIGNFTHLWHTINMEPATAPRPLPNQETQNRSRLARYLFRCLKELDIDYRQAARALKIAPRRIRNMHRTSPQLRVLHPLGAYIEAKYRERASARDSQRGACTT